MNSLKRSDGTRVPGPLRKSSPMFGQITELRFLERIIYLSFGFLFPIDITKTKTLKSKLFFQFTYRRIYLFGRHHLVPEIQSLPRYVHCLLDYLDLALISIRNPSKPIDHCPAYLLLSRNANYKMSEHYLHHWYTSLIRRFLKGNTRFCPSKTSVQNHRFHRPHGLPLPLYPPLHRTLYYASSRVQDLSNLRGNQTPLFELRSYFVHS